MIVLHTYNVLFVPCFFLSFVFFLFVIVLLTFIFLDMCFLFLLKFVDVYLEQQKTKNEIRSKNEKDTINNKKQETGNKKHIVE